ncbi:uncharacterized protein E0L32_001241 [Thyridium curvatum]|uniref:Uncharacterized protein n=1 Tax=Thyridium curvatum TaxID=1093900 RepID=A0A507AU76_9PEZI|nr:uncharacterized protein E0L32_001241 [Thyridium curvatum]TPX10044.1 hypothetical protein E0L32_001241 [Thyridium curvatum]
METSAPKRRRTSPRTSLPIHPGAPPQQQQQSQSQQTQAESTTPPDPPPPTRSNRPSFASPTKSSLARHNPEILQRRRPTSRGGSGSTGTAPQPGASRPTSRHSDVDAMADAQLGQRSEGTAAGPSSSAAYNPRSAPADASRRSPTRRIGGALADQPKRTPTRPKPRPLPPPGPEEAEDLFNPFAGRGLRRSGGLGVLPTESQPEPELPPTPEHPDPEITTPPSGIHNTPSKRPRRSMALNVPRSSPLKQPPSKLRNVARRASPQSEPQPLRRRSARLNGPQPPEPHPGRGVPPVEPDPKKRKIRDALLAEVAGLEADLALASAENERIANLRQVRAEISAPTNRDEILGVLRRHVLSKKEQKVQPPASTDWLRAALNPIAFLPFSKPSTSLPTLFPTEQDNKDDEKDPISHHPIPMTAEEELPYLQAFTPLSFKSTLAMLPSPADDPDAPPLQRHSIFVSSSSPPGVFAARVDMTVNTKTHAITDLAVPKLDPAAMAELNPLVERVLSSRRDFAPQSGLARNVSVLTWAMGEWLRVALRRARFWVLLGRELGTKEAFAETVARIRNRPKRKRRRKAADHDDDDDADAAGEGEQRQLDASAEVSTEDILPHLGRMSMDIDLPNEEACAMRVQWRVEFDWSGDAQSKVGVLLGVPGKWHKADDRGRLGRIPKIFNDLVQDEGDQIDAVRTVAALLAGDAPA